MPNWAYIVIALIALLFIGKLAVTYPLLWFAILLAFLVWLLTKKR